MEEELLIKWMEGQEEINRGLLDQINLLSNKIEIMESKK